MNSNQSTYRDTPQQNGIAKRKNCHLQEVNKALMLSTNVPKYLWGEAVLTATYLINRVPSRVLNHETPLNCLKKCFPDNKQCKLASKSFWVHCFCPYTELISVKT